MRPHAFPPSEDTYKKIRSDITIRVSQTCHHNRDLSNIGLVEVSVFTHTSMGAI